LAKRPDHQRLHLTPRLRTDRLVADALAGTVGIHASKSGRDPLWRPAPVDQMVAHPVVKRDLGEQLAPPTGPAPRRITCLPRNLWIIPAERSTPHQFKPVGAMMPPKKPTDLTQARSPPMLRKDKATFLGDPVPAVSFVANIL